MYLKPFISAIAICCCALMFSQGSIEINRPGNPFTNLSAGELVGQVLIVDSKITYDPNSLILSDNTAVTADPERRSWGYFNKGQSNFPFEEGLILTTGIAREGEGPNNNPANSGSGINWIGDQDLKTVLDATNGDLQETNNATIFEFEFIPNGDSLEFDFIFASEEYEDEYECQSQFRDGFTFLIKGPGIPNDSGTVFGGTNIAKVPGTNNIVVNTGSIHMVGLVCDERPGVDFFPNLYVSNSGANDNGIMEYDGYTEILKTKTAVVSGETYTIKFSIADRGDSDLDSAVFIKGFAVQSNVIIVDENDSELNFSLCQGDSEILTAKSVTTAFSGSETYEWQKDGVIIPGEITSNITVSQTGIYRVLVTDFGDTIEDIIAVTVIPVPNAGDDDILKLCSNDAAVDLFSALGGNPDANGVWTPRLQSGSGIIDPSVDNDGVYTYTVKGTSQISCPDDTATVTVTINQEPTLTLVDTVCSTDGLTYDVNYTVNGAFDITIIPLGAGVVDTVNSKVTGIAANTNITITATDLLNTCGPMSLPVTAPTCGCSNIAEPTNPSNRNICVGADPTLSVDILPNQTANWYDEIGTLVSNGSSIYSPTVTEVGSYTYNVEALDTISGCSSDQIEVTIKINEEPILVLEDVNCAVDQLTYNVSYSVNGLFDITIDPPGAGILDTVNSMVIGIDVNTNISITAIDLSNICGAVLLPITAPVCGCPDIVEPTNPSNKIICFDGEGDSTLSVDVLSGQTANWYDQEGTLLSDGSPTYIPTVKEVGGYVYNVEAVDTATGCASDQITVQFTIVSGSLDLSLKLSRGPFSSNNDIIATAIGEGDFLFSLDEGEPQKSNIFKNVSLGLHDVELTSDIGCGAPVIKSVFVIGFPNFFTPNSDAINDTWNVLADFDLGGMKIYIYDRYGKLLKQLDPDGPGWDGVFNGQHLPATDYWFTAELETGEFFRSHFSLIR